MSRTTISHALAILLALPLGCSSTPSSSGTSQGVVTDTLGNTFDVSCAGGLCTLAPRDPYVVPISCANGSGTDSFLLAMDPLLAIYAVHIPTSGEVQLNAADPSRPVACTSDADCLPTLVTVAGGVPAYACTNGLCQCANAACASSDGKPMTYDILTLCQADILWPTRCPYLTTQPFASRIAEVATLCGSMDTCATVPADCRQLTGAAPIDGGGAPPALAPGVDAGI
jgi:hypothetical protein